MNFQAQLHPTVLFNIIDAVLRHPSGTERTLGTLLGADHEGTIEVANSFPVSYTETAEGQFYLDMDFHKEMVKLNQAVNKKEAVVGWYSTGPVFPLNLATMVNDFYTAGIRQPVYVNVDTTMASGNLGVKAFVLGLDKNAQEKKVIITEIPCHVHATPEEKIAVATLVRTLNQDPQRQGREAPAEMDAFEASLQKVIQMIDACSEYTQHVLDGTIQGDAQVGRLLMETVNAVPSIDVAAFESAFEGKVQDMMMAAYLAKLTKVQLGLAEKLQAPM